MAIIKIGSTDLPAPSVFRIPQYDLDSADTQPNEEGFLQRDRIRQGICRIELEWRGVTNEELATILAAIEPAQLSVTFLAAGSDKTKTMFADARKIELVKNFGIVRWNISFNLIEY